MIQTYRYVYPVEKEFPLEIIVTEDLFAQRLKLAHSPAETEALKAAAETLKASLHLLVLPDDQDQNYYLLLHESLFDHNTGYVQAIGYEYSRVADFEACREKYNITNLRGLDFPDHDCFAFLSEIRACFRGFSLYYNLISIEKKAAMFSYLCELVPQHEAILTHDLPKHMDALGAFYGQCLAVTAYAGIEMSLPDYIKRQPVDVLLAKIRFVVENDSIFENFAEINDTFQDYMENKSKEPFDPNASAAHKHVCNNPHHHH
jgi:hypothetical protein